MPYSCSSITKRTFRCWPKAEITQDAKTAFGPQLQGGLAILRSQYPTVTITAKHTFELTGSDVNDVKLATGRLHTLLTSRAMAPIIKEVDIIA